MRITRCIKAMDQERVYSLVYNNMWFEAEPGRLLCYNVSGLVGGSAAGIHAGYKSIRSEPYGLVAGVVETPIPPGAYGWVLAHGWVSELRVYCTYVFGAADPNDMILYPHRVVAGAMTGTVAGCAATVWRNLGFGGTYLSGAYAQCMGCLILATTSYVRTVTTTTGTGVFYFPAYVRLI